ncbi:hypothetical protein ACEPPU_24000 [Priestia aryabhattai]|uniref:hypothetical protein n=1 Tax=Priestia aryabhattai TaxID=412384 RepID=UPI0035ABB422
MMEHNKDNLQVDYGVYLTDKNTKRVLKMIMEHTSMNEEEARSLVWSHYEIFSEPPEFLVDSDNEPILQYTDYIYTLTPKKNSRYAFPLPLPEFPLCRDEEGEVFYELKVIPK